LFKGSDAPWIDRTKSTDKRPGYVTDGPCLYRTKTCKLLMLWSSYRDGLYVETLATSTSGKLRGPWKQGEVLVGEDSGHGMLFEAFDGRLMLVLHQPFRRARGKLFEMEDTGDTLRIKRRCRKRGPLKLRTVRSSAGVTAIAMALFRPAYVAEKTRYSGEDHHPAFKGTSTRRMLNELADKHGF
jgi:hypothetical protein